MRRTDDEIEQFVDWDATAEIDFYKDEQFDTIIPTSALTIGNRLHFQLTWADTFSKNFPVVFYINDCSVYLMDESDSFDVINNACLSSIVKTRLHSDTVYARDNVKYSYKSFSFFQGTYKHKFKLQCVLKFCLESEVASNQCGYDENACLQHYITPSLYTP